MQLALQTFLQTFFDALTALVLGASAVALLVEGRRALREWRLLGELRQRGRTAQARITGQSVRRRIGLLLAVTPQYYVSFGFLLDGAPYRLEQRVGRKTYRMAQVGALVAVRYLPGAAHLARLDGPYTDYTAAHAHTLNTLLALAWALVLWYALAPGLLWR